jgi:uncharacterized protein YbbC (DUF1343 family)
MPVSTGFDVLRWAGYRALRGRRVALFTNHSAIDRRLRSAHGGFARDLRDDLVALFSPEHGLSGAAPAGEPIGACTDPLTSLPVHSLYGDTWRPTDAMLDGLDIIVCDIQDIGVRYYTYVWTVSHILEAAGARGVAVLILDRPNPLGGSSVVGPLLDPALSSLVGRHPVPVCPGMTLGELALMIDAEWNPTSAGAEVIPCVGWRRRQIWEQTELPWVAPSPNMPHLSTLAHYPGACLVEGTTVSEGRGTALPFEIVGAPWIGGDRLADHLNAQPWAGRRGAAFRAHAFRPTASKWAGEVCQGVQVYIADRAAWRPLEVWLGVIAAIHRLHAESNLWRPEPLGGGAHHFDRLIGSTAIRPQLAEAARQDAIGDWLDALAAAWREAEEAFRQARAPYLLYR